MFVSSQTSNSPFICIVNTKLRCSPQESHTVTLSSATDGFSGGVSCIAWSRNGTRLAILANDEPLGLWIYEAPQTTFVSRIEQGPQVPNEEVFSAVDFCCAGSSRYVAGSVRGRLYVVSPFEICFSNSHRCGFLRGSLFMSLGQKSLFSHARLN